MVKSETRVAERTSKGNFILLVIFFLNLGPGNKYAFTLSKCTHLGFVHLSVYMSYFNKFLFETQGSSLEGEIIIKTFL